MSQVIAILGAGFMGETHARAFGKGGLDARVKYVLATRPASAAKLAAALPGEVIPTTDYAAILADPEVDAVSVCTPTDTHRDLVRRAAEAGKHVLCEKPIALTVADAEAMRRVCAEKGVIFMVAHVLRFWPEYVQAAAMVARGEIGRLQRISCQRLSAAPVWSPADNWFRDLGRSGGAVVDLAIHDFDFVAWLAGMPSAVAAKGDVHQFTALFDLPGGVVATVEASNRMPPGFPFRMAFRLVGDAGAIEFGGSGGSLFVVRDGEGKQVPVEGSRTFAQNVAASEALDGYFFQIAHFVACLAKGQGPERGTPEAATEALAIALRVRDALG